MICEQRIGLIVMLCQEVENGKIMSENYWSSKDPMLDELHVGFYRILVEKEEEV